MAKTRQPKKKITRDRDGQYRWKLYGGNGELQATGEGHGSQADARRAFVDAAYNMAAVSLSMLGRAR